MNVGRPLFITGCPRSGTSLTVEAFRRIGVDAGKTLTSQGEHRRIREEVLKPILRAGGMDPLGLTSWTDVEPDPSAELRTIANPKALRRAVLERLLPELQDPAAPWLYKDVKLVFCWRLWAAAFPEATWVTVWRDRAEIVESMERWGMHSRHPFDPSAVVHEHHVRSGRIPGAVPLTPSAFIEGHDAGFRHVAGRLGLSWSLEAAQGAIDPNKFQPATKKPPPPPKRGGG